ncbi:uncharacterized protein LOC128554059 [Mercenaria mercenaria]|uniref:uncharacterized protein LOC128554059 n=1 Tax=Mercenaria mercenaria TaxID=6596 RepID=UPI00234F1F4B|nr:uncharacterized protein LOC128554059 [Mercenaria mercenaria]
MHLLQELNSLDGTSVTITSPDIKRLTQVMEEYFPGTSFSSIQLTEGANQLFDWFLNDGMRTLEEEIQSRSLRLNYVEVRKTIYKAIGGVAGASVVGGPGVVAAGGIAALIGAPVVLPAVAAGVVATGLGFIAGKAGGAVIAMFDEIL